MALIRGLRRLFLASAVLGLAACGNEPGSAFDQVAAGLVSALQKAPGSDVTATRASLLASGFNEPLIIVALQEAGTRGGMLKPLVKNGITIWQSADGHSTASFDGGVLRNSTGLSHDLYGAQTGAVRKAISSGASTSYNRTYRHLNGEGRLEVLRFNCKISSAGRQTIIVFDRRHDTQLFEERCNAESADASGVVQTLENRYWRDVSGATLWKSKQWMSRQMGYMTVERVFN